MVMQSTDRSDRVALESKIGFGVAKIALTTGYSSAR